MLFSNRLEDMPYPIFAPEANERSWMYYIQQNPDPIFHICYKRLNFSDSNEPAEKVLVTASLDILMPMMEDKNIMIVYVHFICPPELNWTDKWEMWVINEIYQCNVMGGKSELGYMVVPERYSQFVVSPVRYQLTEDLQNIQLIYKRSSD